MEKKRLDVGYVTLSIFLILYILIVSCSREHSKYQANEKEELVDLEDTCNFCALDSFSVKPITRDLNSRLIVDKAVAIVFFNRFYLMNRYHNETSYDTLMKIFHMKNRGDRKIIYDMTEQYFYFDKDIKPILKDNSVAIIDTIKNTPTIMFKDKNISFVIDLQKYKDHDGVLMFSPGKKPIFWTFEGEQNYCKGLFGMAQQYYECSSH